MCQLSRTIEANECMTFCFTYFHGFEKSINSKLERNVENICMNPLDQSIFERVGHALDVSKLINMDTLILNKVHNYIFLIIEMLIHIYDKENNSS